MSEALIKWIMFRVAVGLIPIVLNFLDLASDNPKLGEMLKLALSSGPLLLVGGALCGGALGELMSTPKRHPTARLLCGGTSALVLAIGASYYMTIAGKIQANQPPDATFVVWVSVALYFIGVAAALGCVIIAENAKRYGAST